MNKTTKILLAAAVLILLSYPGLAWMSGIAIQNRIQQGEQQVLARLPYLTLLRREYHRGVYRSTEVTTYGLRNPVLQAMSAGAGGVPPAAVTVTVTNNIQHGPLPGLHALALATVDSTVTGPPALQQALFGSGGAQALLELHSTIGLFGGASGTVSSPAFNLKLPNGISIAWGGLTGKGSSNRNQAHVSGQLSAPRLAVQGPQAGFELTGLEYSGANAKAFNDLYLGTANFTIERVDGNGPRAGDFSLQRIAITTTSKADGDFFNMRVDVAVDSAKVAAVQLQNVMYSESVEHIHGPSLAAMTQAIRAAQQQAAGNQVQLRAAMQSAVRQYGSALLVRNPVIDIRQLSFTMPEGSLLFSARVSAPGLSTSDLQSPLAAVLALKTHAVVTADLRVDNGLLQKLLAISGASPRISAQLTVLEQQGYLAAGASAVTTHLEYSGGRLTLNKHPFPPAPPVN